jgi:uncharacterized protein UPF0158
MAVVVSLRKVVDEIDALMEGYTAYLNRQTGELHTLQEDDAELVADDADLEDLPDWQRDAIPVIREILESGDWLALPTKFDIHEWAIMDEFSCSVDDPEVRNELRNAIRGAGAFRYFKDTIHRHGLQEIWYSYRTAVLDRIAIDWLDEHEIAHTRDESSASAG